MKKIKKLATVFNNNILITGFVMSGFVHDLDIEFLDEYDNTAEFDRELIEEEAKQILVDEYYNPEMEF